MAQTDITINATNFVRVEVNEDDVDVYRYFWGTRGRRHAPLRIITDKDWNHLGGVGVQDGRTISGTLTGPLSALERH